MAVMTPSEISEVPTIEKAKSAHPLADAVRAYPKDETCRGAYRHGDLLCSASIVAEVLGLDVAAIKHDVDVGAQVQKTLYDHGFTMGEIGEICVRNNQPGRYEWANESGEAYTDRVADYLEALGR